MSELSHSLKAIRHNDPFDPYYYRKRYAFANKQDVVHFVKDQSKPDKERSFLKAMIVLIEKELEEGEQSLVLNSITH